MFFVDVIVIMKRTFSLVGRVQTVRVTEMCGNNLRHPCLLSSQRMCGRESVLKVMQDAGHDVGTASFIRDAFERKSQDERVVVCPTIGNACPLIAPGIDKALDGRREGSDAGRRGDCIGLFVGCAGQPEADARTEDFGLLGMKQVIHRNVFQQIGKRPVCLLVQMGPTDEQTSSVLAVVAEGTFQGR